MRNLCWTRSTRTVWVSAAPAQITLPYSKMERTLEKYARITACLLNRGPGVPVWKARMSSPNERLALLTTLVIWGVK